MKKFSKPIAFEWDKGNRYKNWEKHKVDDKEAEEVFFNRPFINRPFIAIKDQKHSQNERRFQGLGRTNINRKLFVSFTLRGSKIRVISIRDMNKKERSQYEKA